MKIKRSERGRCKLRTLASLHEDYKKFIQSGYNIKNARCYNNVIEEAMFDIPVDQVFVIPFLSNLPIHVILQKERGLEVGFKFRS